MMFSHMKTSVEEMTLTSIDFFSVCGCQTKKSLQLRNDSLSLIALFLVYMWALLLSVSTISPIQLFYLLVFF